MIKFYFTVIFLLSFIRSQDTTFQCQGWAQESVGPYIIENNVWGQGSIDNYSQCIYVINNSTFGWNWDWPNEGSHVKSYPEVMFGKKPWSSSSTHPSMPLKAQNVESFVVNFDLQMEASGSYNLAFEFWVTSDSLSDENGITTEVMIWTAGEELQAAGEHISTPYFDGYFYKLYRAEFENWIYYAFVSEEDQFQGALQIHNFINYMVSIGHLNPDEYVANFEMGNEVVYGSGQTDINSYSVSVNQVLGILAPNINDSRFTVFEPKPNPFNPVTAISYELKNTEIINISIYDVAGNHIENLLDETQQVGQHTITWNGKNKQGNFVSAGLYFCNVTIGNSKPMIKKMVLLK